MNFRKVVFALATAGLGLTGVASAQITCTSAAITTPPQALVRVEGATEMVSGVTVGGCSLANTIASYTITVTTTAGIANTNVSGQNYTDATATFLGGTAVNGTLSGNTLTFTTTTLPGTPTAAIIISGVRVNASSQAANMTINETVSAGTGVQFTGTAGNAIAVAYTQPGMAKPAVLGFKNVAICSAGTAVVPLLEAEISSGFAGSFAPDSGTGGTYISVMFGNLAPGAKYYVPVSVSGAGNVLGGITASLVADNTSTTTLAGGNIGPTGGTVGGQSQLTLSGTSATALYYVTGATTGTEAFVVPLYAVTTTGATAGVTSAPTVSASFMSPSTGYDQYSTSQTQSTVAASGTATAITGLAFPVITIGSNTYGPASNNGGGQLSSCATTLLFPYILNSGGYDTGIALTNSSAGTSLSQDGTCSMMFYGTGAPSTNPYVTGAITAGTVGAFTVSSVASGFQGYAIATCNFQDAHGFAFITDGYGQAGRGLSQGYLAIVTSAGGTSVSAPF
jgi:hypothetical protein